MVRGRSAVAAPVAAPVALIIATTAIAATIIAATALVYKGICERLEIANIVDGWDLFEPWIVNTSQLQDIVDTCFRKILDGRNTNRFHSIYILGAHKR